MLKVKSKDVLYIHVYCINDIYKSFFSQFFHTNNQCRKQLCNIEFKQCYTFTVPQFHFKIDNTKILYTL